MEWRQRKTMESEEENIGGLIRRREQRRVRVMRARVRVRVRRARVVSDE